MTDISVNTLLKCHDLLDAKNRIQCVPGSRKKGFSHDTFIIRKWDMLYLMQHHAPFKVLLFPFKHNCPQYTWLGFGVNKPSVTVYFHMNF